MLAKKAEERGQYEMICIGSQSSDGKLGLIKATPHKACAEDA